jgi:predicted ferric reductase
MNFKDKLTAKEIGYLLSLVESDYEEVAQYVDSKELEKEDREQYIYYCEQYALIDNLRKKLDLCAFHESNRGGGVTPDLTLSKF